MIVFFGSHEIIEQWQEVIGDDARFSFCKTYAELANYEPKSTFVVYVRIPENASMRIAVKLKLKGYKVAKFLAGTDSRYFGDAKGWRKLLAKYLYKLCLDKNLSPATWLAKVLEANGLKTDYWQSCSPIFIKGENIAPERSEAPAKAIQKVLVYSNPDRHWIYSTELMLKLANDLPYLHFVFVGDHTLIFDKNVNAESRGRISQDELFSLYKECDVLLRITSHDGYSRMAIEGMYFGMHIITNWPVPHAIVCQTEEEIKEALNRQVGFNLQGNEFVRKEFNVLHWKDTLINALS